MKRIACLIGINDYVGSANDLSGCVNDSLWLADWSYARGYDVRMLLNHQATDRAIAAMIQRARAELDEGDAFFLGYSGHGSNEPDEDGDEADRYDEGIISSNMVFISDDRIRHLFDGFAALSFFGVWADSCYSGSATRSALVYRDPVVPHRPGYSLVRYMPMAGSVCIASGIRRGRMWCGSKPESEMQEVLLTGCAEHEVSFDAYLDGRPCGAMTGMARRIVAEDYRRNWTWAELHHELRLRLPAEAYPQTPQLEGHPVKKQGVILP